MTIKRHKNEKKTSAKQKVQQWNDTGQPIEAMGREDDNNNSSSSDNIKTIWPKNGRKNKNASTKIPKVIVCANAHLHQWARTHSSRSRQRYQISYQNKMKNKIKNKKKIRQQQQQQTEVTAPRKVRNELPINFKFVKARRACRTHKNK